MADKKSGGTIRHQFGTFGGVFTPSILTILGVIMFLRVGFVVGQAGIRGAIIILVICEAIALLTALSLAAISTNTPVRGGGAYYLISRVLGPGFGGSIGLALFLAQALSIPFYIIGFTEAVVQSFPVLRPWFEIVAVGTTVLLFTINYIGAGWAIRTQFVVMILLFIGVFSFLGGSALLFDPELFAANWQSAYTHGATTYNFWVIFAIYFPAVTGIMAGVNMSGDLKDPAKSLVRGTLLAIGVGFLVYLGEMVLSGGSQTRADLITRPYEMLLRNAFLGGGFFVMGGVFAAALSSALGSFLGAPRVMQALARDCVLPGLKPFSHGSKKGDEPRSALLLSMLITLGVIWYASGRSGLDAFDLVAAIVTMFFLCTYGMVNLAAFVESFGLNPSFRPSFRFYHWATALAGAGACLAVMLLIDWIASLVAVVIIIVLYSVISRHAITATYGDARRGFVYSLVAKNLQRLGAMIPHAKNWRPTFLVLSGNPETRLVLIKYAGWLEAGRGIVSMAELVAGNVGDLIDRRKAISERTGKWIKERGLNVYLDTVVTPDLDEGIRVLLQSHSLTPIEPNIVLVGWPRERERVVPYVRHLRDIRLLNKSVICVIGQKIPGPDEPKRIDIWWRGKENGSLMLILAHLLTENWEWGNASIRILREVSEEAGREPSHKAMAELAQAARIEAEVVVVVSRDPFAEVMPKYSRNATVVFLGFQPPDEDQALSFYEQQEKLVKDMPTTILVSSNGEADLLA